MTLSAATRTNQTADGFDVYCTTTVATGTLYAIADANTAEPTAEQIVAGQNADGDPADAAGSAILSNAGETPHIALTGLTEGTEYGYWMCQDESGLYKWSANFDGIANGTNLNGPSAYGSDVTTMFFINAGVIAQAFGGGAGGSANYAQYTFGHTHAMSESQYVQAKLLQHLGASSQAHSLQIRVMRENPGVDAVPQVTTSRITLNIGTSTNNNVELRKGGSSSVVLGTLVPTGGMAALVGKVIRLEVRDDAGTQRISVMADGEPIPADSGNLTDIEYSGSLLSTGPSYAGFKIHTIAAGTTSIPIWDDFECGEL